MAYYVGDIPAQPLVIFEPSRGDELIDLTLFDTATTVLRDFDGVVIAADFDATIEADAISIAWPATTVFATEGLYSLTVTLSKTGSSVLERLAPVYLIAQEENGWHTLDSARAAWADAPSDDMRLFTILVVAQNDCEVFGTSIPAGITRQLAYKTAQLLQARNLWNAGKVDPATGGIGEDSFVMRPFPLDWQIKQTLRPKSAIPAVG